MERRWTPEQQDAIEARDGTVLVSAAAGSGKTAVLVERFIRRITDPVAPVDADRMLVVTFTRAAAGEMRERILAALNARIAAEPGNAALRRQKLCLARAHISTVHGFCSDLLREFFCRVDIAPDFRVADDREEETLLQAALDAVLEEAYAGPDFEEFAGAFSGERDDGPLMDILLALYRFTQSHPFPQEWLEEKLALYTAPGRAEDSVWGQALLVHAADVLQGCVDMLCAAREMLQEDEKLQAAYDPVYAGDVEMLRQMAVLAREKDWDGLAARLGSVKFPTARAPRGYGDDPLKLRAAAVRDEAKAAVKKLAKLFVTDSAGCVEELRQVYPYARRLTELLGRFTQVYGEAKREKGLLDFSDLEHLVLRLLYDRDETGRRVPSAVAAEIAARFDEIMVDEYQDTNEAQDSLFAAISRGGENLFMVGDVKQSIYGFRQAMPRIFLQYKKEFSPFCREEPAYPACITLDRNFRSRFEVTDSVNFVFSQLMSEAAGDVDYTGTERLVPAATYPESTACTTELAVLPRAEDADVPHAEALWIARRIKQMLAEGFTVSDHGETRPARPGDFCVLLRAANRTAHVYASVMSAAGVPARASLTGSFFGTAEIRLVLSFLRAVDNPAQDIPLLAVLMSPVYGFTPDETARLRADTRGDPLVTSLSRHGDDPKCARVLEDLGVYRRLAGSMTSEMFLNYLLEKTGLEDVVLAMEDGTARLENLRLLRRYAASYESSGYHGIGAFLRFLDQLAARKGDLEAADPLTDAEDAVQIMSIHKSKGLEFPVCIVAGCGRQFVNRTPDAAVHPELGLGLKLRRADAPVRYTTMPRDAILTQILQGERAEELRILYVAMTRAREKLILVGSLRDRERTLSVLSCRLGSGERISPYAVKSVHSVLEWLLLCALRHPDGGELRALCSRGNEVLAPGGEARWEISLPEIPREETVPGEEQPLPAPVDEAFLAELRRAAAFRYPWEGINTLPSKVAVTAIAEAHEPGEYPLATPAFLQAGEMTPAEKGTAVHAFLQFLDLRTPPEQLEAECLRLVEQNFITRRQLAAVERPQIRQLLSSPLGKRIRQSQTVLREYRFSVPIPAGMAVPAAPAGFEEETVVLQGAVDCLFEENGAWYIVDFKTDRVHRVEELKDRYARQLELYTLAVEQTTGKTVAGRILYSVRLGKSISF